MDSNIITGSCHCGNVKFRGEIEKNLRNSITEKCNCSICFKTRLWYIKVNEKNLEVNKGKDNMEIYEFGQKDNTYYFCKNCHIELFGLYKPKNKPNVNAFYVVSVATIDGLSPKDLSELKVIYLDGLNDNLESKPEYTHYL
ncbi:hypothetical protein DICPUDRAFT_80022 [Dictyostelium purpureum]|uniref:CENP-V/GFA domain-containing protein n=1 Tax=Dictyostelium purpureum TaxID=5786 RepID=F0ZPB0_DICPU|nr:uncharacterized protein DICPUDRAFT_80022 [Dictyostelium purpureum]EGC34202.1 hypothetical protein DICPUDRAFT_80022 [Dictyostelium purpureum]|eukprot:XP_003289254.1 hypothetical protein DICPUDRAFT_80022 [Dictyostelium purpureum]